MNVFACACFCTLVMHDMKETKKEGEEEIFSVMPKLRTLIYLQLKPPPPFKKIVDTLKQLTFSF